MLFAAGREIDQIKAIRDAVTKPANVAVVAAMGLSRDEILAVGVQRISTAGGLTYAAANAVIEAAVRVRDFGTFSGLGLPNRVTELGA